MTAGGPGRPVHLSPDLPLPQGRPLVVDFLAPRQAELDLRPAILEIEPQGDKRETPLADLAGQTRDLSASAEKLSISFGVVVRIGAVTVRADMAAEEPPLSVAHGRVAVLEVDLTG